MRTLSRMLVGMLILGLAIPAVAADEDTTSLQQQVEALRKRIEEQALELERLRTEQQALLEKLKAPAGAPTPAGPTGASALGSASQSPQAKPESGSWWKSNLLTIGGYGSFRFETNNIGGGELIPSGSASGFTFRRFVLTTDSRFNDRIRIYSETELERLVEIELEKSARRGAGGVGFAQEVEGNSGAEIGLEQLWLQYDLGKGQGIRAGLVLPPLGRFNILHDDDYWDVPRRTLVDRDAPIVPVKTAWRELGAGLVGSLPVGASGKLDYQVYLLGGSTLDFNIESVVQTRTPQRNKLELEAEVGLGSGAVDGTRNAEALGWRVAYSPSLAGEIAFSGYHGQYTPSFIEVDEPVNSFGLDGKWRFGAFEVEGEAIYSTFGNTDAVARSFAQSVFNSSAETESDETAELENEIEIDLSGLARHRYGFWTDFKYHWRPAFLKNSFLGRGFEDPQLIPIVRYERVWLRGNIEELGFADGTITNLERANYQQDRVTLGVNYRPVQRIGFQLAYEHNQRRTGQQLIFPRVQRRDSDGFLMGLTFGF